MARMGPPTIRPQVQTWYLHFLHKTFSCLSDRIVSCKQYHITIRERKCQRYIYLPRKWLVLSQYPQGSLQCVSPGEQTLLRTSPTSSPNLSMTLPVIESKKPPPLLWGSTRLPAVSASAEELSRRWGRSRARNMTTVDLILVLEMPTIGHH